MTTHQEIGISVTVYEPLVIGGAKVDDLSVNLNTYSHTLQANGGFDSMNVSLAMDRASVDEWIEQGIGRHIVVYNSANAVCWEGFVNVVNAELGSYKVAIGPLVDVGNRVSVAYAELDTSLSPPVTGDKTVTTISENFVSQERHGIIEKLISAGRITTDEAELIRDTFLVESAYPATSSEISIGRSGEPSVSLECLGYWYWTNLYIYNNTDPYAVRVDDRIRHILESNPNIGMFGNLNIQDNASIVPSETDDDKTAMAHIKGHLALGGANEQRYTLGFYENRDAIYQEIPTTPAYRFTMSDQGQKILTFEGALVYPWDVRPGQWIFVADALMGRHTESMYEDPRYIFIEKVNYNSPWQITMTGSRIGTFEQIMARFGLGDF